MAGDGGPARLHATAIAVGEAGLLLRGASGSGKTSLALALIGLAHGEGGFARLVGDDRVAVSVRAARLVARPVEPLAGLIERRGLGLTPVPHLDAVVLRFVVDCLGAEPPRMPEPEELVTEIAGVTLPRLAVHGRAEDAGVVLAALRLFSSPG